MTAHRHTPSLTDGEREILTNLMKRLDAMKDGPPIKLELPVEHFALVQRAWEEMKASGYPIPESIWAAARRLGVEEAESSSDEVMVLAVAKMAWEALKATGRPIPEAFYERARALGVEDDKAPDQPT